LFFLDAPGRQEDSVLFTSVEVLFFINYAQQTERQTQKKLGQCQ